MKNFLSLFFIVLLSLAATGCDSGGGGGSSDEGGPVSAEHIVEEYLADAVAFLVFDPREFPEPEFPGDSLENENYGDELQDSLDVLQLARDAFGLDTGEIPSYNPNISGWLNILDIIGVTDCTCSDWKTVKETSISGYYSRTRESVCCNFHMTLTTTNLGTIGSTLELRYDGLDSAHGTEYNDYLAYKCSVMYAGNVVTVSQSQEQNPEDPAPWWESQIVYTFLGEINQSPKSFTEWTMKSYLYDALYQGTGGYRPWHQTTFTTDVEGNLTITVEAWSLNKEKLFPWVYIIYPHDGGCTTYECEEDSPCSEPVPCE